MEAHPTRLLVNGFLAGPLSLKQTRFPRINCFNCVLDRAAFLKVPHTEEYIDGTYQLCYDEAFMPSDPTEPVKAANPP